MWQTSYPTLAQVQEAHWQTLDTWCEKLPQPQTDVERTVYRRIHKLRHERVGQEVRKSSPEFADKWNDILGRMAEVVGGPKPARW